MRRIVFKHIRDKINQASQALTTQVRGVKYFSMPGILLLSLLLDFSVWFPMICRSIALLFQAGVLVKLAFEEKLLHLRFRRLSWQKKLIPIALFGVCLLFYFEKVVILFSMWGESFDFLINPYRAYSMIFFMSSFAIYGLRLNIIARFLGGLHLRPAQTMTMGFLLVILVGTMLLSLPQMVIDPSKIVIIDALFTATSATTVTGLTLGPISEFYRPSGIWVILFLIQTGGLGIMTFGVLFSLVSNKRIKLQDAVALQGVLETESVGTVRKEIRLIFLLTLVIETLGALLIYLFLPKETDQPIFTAIFHAVSAFCNAGFSLFSTNLEGFLGNIPMNGVIAVLVILGGIGFPVISNLLSYPMRRKGRAAWRLSFHSKMVLSISGGLLAVGTLGIYILEFQGTLAGLSWFDKWFAAFFHSVTARTAGFNTLNVGDFSDATLFLLILLMWIGGSPASTAGGIKTTTFGVMLATLKAMLNQREQVSLFRRSFSPLAVRKSLSIAFSSSALLAMFLLLLLFTEEGDFKAIVFESVSAFNTVGLSTGITSELSPIGKLIIIVTMFIGRIGSLTLAFSIAERVMKGKYTYPEERIIIG
ncbi:KtrAB potassium uptake system, integral membrane component KtrB [hydrothermal vent metagenome]|uniref:KtrAB potassium uptake system, integral membrane component KtrB n=1 Tax=hydrothermal vent metagenome TaxID=652676 RepID=A0A3B1DW80_9ZZZZ